MLLWNLLAGKSPHAMFPADRPLVEILEDRPLLSFFTAPSYPAGPSPNSVAVGDFNGDGIPDLAVANWGLPGTVRVLLGKGDGSFQAAQSYTLGKDPWCVAVGDF